VLFIRVRLFSVTLRLHESTVFCKTAECSVFIVCLMQHKLLFLHYNVSMLSFFAFSSQIR